MRNLRKSLVLLGLCTTIPAWAAFPAGTDPTEVSVPSFPNSKFMVGVSGVLLQPSTTGNLFDYATLTTVNSLTSVTNNVEAVDPGYTWGFGIDIGYAIPGTGNDIAAKYFHFDSNDDAATSVVPETANFITPIGFAEDIFTTGSTAADIDIDQVDLILGQAIYVGCRLQLHPFAGARYADLESRLTNTYNVTTAGGFSNTLNSTADTNFHGIGPMAGMDASYYLGRGFGIVGHVDSALLFGSVDSSLDTTTITVIPSTTFTDIENITAEGTNRTVPVVDMKFGLNYTYIFDPQYPYNLTIEAGYQVSHYFNTFDNITTSGGEVSTISTSTSDLGLNGFYASLVYRT